MGSATVSEERRDRQVMTTEEVADFLRVSPATLYGWRYNRRGPRAHRVGRELRYLKADVVEWLVSQ